MILQVTNLDLRADAAETASSVTDGSEASSDKQPDNVKYAIFYCVYYCEIL